MNLFYHCSNSQFTLLADAAPIDEWIPTAPPDMDIIYRWNRESSEWEVSPETGTVTIYYYSKLKILRKLKALGLWASVKTALETADAYDEWLVAQVLASNDPLLLSILEQFKTQFPDENANSILAECIAD